MVDMIILHLKEITLSTKLLVFNTSLLLLGLMWKATYFHSKGGDRYLIGNVVTLQKNDGAWKQHLAIISYLYHKAFTNIGFQAKHSSKTPLDNK